MGGEFRSLVKGNLLIFSGWVGGDQYSPHPLTWSQSSRVSHSTLFTNGSWTVFGKRNGKNKNATKPSPRSQPNKNKRTNTFILPQLTLLSSLQYPLDLTLIVQYSTVQYALPFNQSIVKGIHNKNVRLLRIQCQCVSTATTK